MTDDNNIIRFILREKYLTATTLGSIFTFAFISSMKEDIIDPLILFMLPVQNFDYMNITIRDGEKFEMPEKQLELKFGNFFRSFVTWLLLILFLYILCKYTNFPDTLLGNTKGSAIW
jgi:large-conductance mechanosensitive channel